MLRINKENRDTAQFYMALALLIVGAFASLYAELFIEPIGEISGSVLGFTGECFSFAGGMLGIVTWVNGRLKDYDKRAKDEL